jgi:hypothetical protein
MIKEEAVKYLCLVYNEEKKLDTMSKSESDAFIGEHLAYDEVLRKSVTILSRRPSNPFRPPRPCGSGTTRCP